MPMVAAKHPFPSLNVRKKLITDNTKLPIKKSVDPTLKPESIKMIINIRAPNTGVKGNNKNTIAPCS